MNNEQMLQHMVTSMAKGHAYDAQVESSLTAQNTSAKTQIEALEIELKTWKEIVAARDAKLMLLETDNAELKTKLDAVAKRAAKKKTRVAKKPSTKAPATIEAPQ